MTLADLCDAYLLKHWRGKDPGRPAMVGWWVDDLGNTRLRDLDRQKVQAALMRYKAGKARRGDGLDPVTRKPRSTAGNKSRSGAAVNRYRAVLGAVLKYGRGHHGLTLDPLRDIPKEPESRGRTRHLDQGELGRLLTACESACWDRLRLLVLMAVGSGARLGELQGLRWVDVDVVPGGQWCQPVGDRRGVGAQVCCLDGPVLAPRHRSETSTDRCCVR